MKTLLSMFLTHQRLLRPKSTLVLLRQQ